MNTTTKYFNVENLFESAQSVNSLLTILDICITYGKENASKNWVYICQGLTKDEMNKKFLLTSEEWFSEEKVVLEYDDMIERLKGWIAIGVAKGLYDKDEYLEDSLSKIDELITDYKNDDFTMGSVEALKEAIKESFRAYEALALSYESAGRPEKAAYVRELIEKSLGKEFIKDTTN